MRADHSEQRSAPIIALLHELCGLTEEGIAVLEDQYH